MLELSLNITESKILHSYKNNGNNKVFIYNNALLKKPSKLTVIGFVKVQKLKYYSFLMPARRTNITVDKIVVRYEKSGNKLDLSKFVSFGCSLTVHC